MRLERSPLTSPKNPALQTIRKAIAAGRETKAGCVVIEGPHLVAEARRSRCALEEVYVSPEARKHFRVLLEDSGAEVIEVSSRALASISDTQTTQGILATLRLPVWTWQDLTRSPACLVILDGVQDPGNAGTIIRSAEAFDATGIIFLSGSVHTSNGKFLRASAGSIFRVPFLEGISRNDLIGLLNGSQTRLYALSAQAGTVFDDVPLSVPCAIVTGAEGSGISPEIAREAEMISIPAARVESLNTAVACSLALFEVSRQRRLQ